MVFGNFENVFVLRDAFKAVPSADTRRFYNNSTRIRFFWNNITLYCWRWSAAIIMNYYPNDLCNGTLIIAFSMLSSPKIGSNGRRWWFFFHSRALNERNRPGVKIDWGPISSLDCRGKVAFLSVFSILRWIRRYLFVIYGLFFQRWFDFSHATR